MLQLIAMHKREVIITSLLLKLENHIKELTSGPKFTDDHH